jgi:glycosyltransferase involved in cell wall biosynthesis
MTTTNPPLFGDIGILALVHHNWGPLWLTPHHVLTRLGRYFHVVWSEPPHEWRAIRQSLEKRSALAVNSDLSLPLGFQFYVPELWLPKIYRPGWIDKLTFEQRIRQGARRLKREGCRKLVLYLWHPQFEPVLCSRGFDLKIYHVDDEYSFLPNPPPTEARELRVLNSVDQVFVVSPALLERKGGINPHTASIPEGVDYQLYTTRAAEPNDLMDIPRPRIGYTGYLKQQLDWPLLRDLATRHPEWQFVFVGPLKIQQGIDEFVREISQSKNVHFLGPKSVTALASYAQHFDVCIMPYRVDGYTNNIYPLKLHEYLASGRPVVSTPIRSLREFSSVIALAESTDDWSHAITDALGERANCSERVAERQNIAREYDWDRLVHKIAQTLCERMGSEYLHRFHEIASRHCDQPYSA